MNGTALKTIFLPAFKKVVIAVLFAAPLVLRAQTGVDSLKYLILKAKSDTTKVILMDRLAQAYRDEEKVDLSILTYKQALKLNEKINYSVLRQRGQLSAIDYMLYETGDYAESLTYAERELAITEKMKDKFHAGFVHLVFGHNYRGLGYYRESLNHYFKAKQIIKAYDLSRGEPEDNIYTIQCIGNTYLKMNQLDSALIFTQEAYKQAMAKPGYGYILYAWRVFSDIYLARHDYPTALHYCRLYVSNFEKFKERNRDLGFVFINLSRIFKKLGPIDSAIFYAKKGLANAQKFKDQENIYNASTALYNFYQVRDGHKVRSVSIDDSNDDNKTDILKAEAPTVNKLKIYRLKQELSLAKTDSAKVEIWKAIGQQYRDNSEVDLSIQSYQKALEILSRHKPTLTQIYVLNTLDFLCNATGNYLLSMKYAFSALELSRQQKYEVGQATALGNIANNYAGMGNYRKSLESHFKAKKLLGKYDPGHWEIQNIAETYLKMHMLDSALHYNKIAYHIADTGHHQEYMLAFAARVFAAIYAEKGEDELALKYYKRFVSDFYRNNLNNREIDRAYLGMAKLYQKEGKTDSSTVYAKKALSAAKHYNDEEHILLASNFLYAANDSLHNESEAFKYFKIAAAAKDSMSSIDKMRQIQTLTFNQQVREKEQADLEAKQAARLRLILTIAGIVILIASFLIWNRIRQLRLRYKMILEQKDLEKLRAIDKMKEKFFSNITHELRTPLSLIMSPAQFYLEHPDELKDTGKLLESFFANSCHLLNLINQLLDISKLDAGKMPVALSRGDFGYCAGSFLKSFEEEASQKQIKLHFASGLIGEHLFDEEHWKKIISNLVGNSLKFTPPGGDIFVSVRQTGGTAAKSEVSIIVKDTGIGIDENVLPFITDRFYQADNNLSRKYGGTGIGLALVNDLVKLMEGELTIESVKGQGTMVTISMQLQGATGKVGYPDAIPLSAVSPLSIKNKETGGPVEFIDTQDDKRALVLVTEDNQELRDFLRNSLEPLAKVITASNGRDGYDMALVQIPDIILSDVMMPGMDGFEFCDKIKSNPATSHIPFIILSAKNNYESKITGLTYGADDYLTKPFGVDELRAKIKNILNAQRISRTHYLEELMSDEPDRPYAEMQEEFLKKTFALIGEHLDDSRLSVKFLAAKMNLDHSALNKKFMFFLGLSTNELIRQFKVKKEKMEYHLLDLEAKTLRAQMNPHFIFNCLNSIKALIQQEDGSKAVSYLTTFSRLLRNILQNSDKREVSLYDELETCKLYIQLEAMRFGNKFSYEFNIDERADLKSAKVPALIIQPFIENAIWHGIMPGPEGGMVSLNVDQVGNTIRCVIDDNGIGREQSRQNQFNGTQSGHQSKGIYLTQSRLNLHSVLNSSNASVEITDKHDEEKPLGTKVTLTFNEY